ncbi:hypothetical protein QWT87_16410 [Chryseobacterium sp. APV1]|uniref:Uncharacterized protein n=1 Tax=Chryseobacterium urinae TaxID=3058400 RepID=A0ABT8U5Y3_9FLAO|nr:hypothetical protein [Chryseobacterium sp. APV1]MDO3426465.1 hypothetical protein [Chryseobacterium sp. APV1]
MSDKKVSGRGAGAISSRTWLIRRKFKKEFVKASVSPSVNSPIICSMIS